MDESSISGTGADTAMSGSLELRGTLRELRFNVGRERQRISHYIASGRRIVLLTVSRKTKMHEVQEVARAWAPMHRCEGHDAED